MTDKMVKNELNEIIKEDKKNKTEIKYVPYHREYSTVNRTF